MPLRQGLYRQASGIRRPAQVTFLCVPGTASLRGASGASEPGIQAWTPRVVLDSGLRPTAGPGMAGEKRLRAVLQFISTASRLRARLLVQSLAQPQGAAAGRIPQSAPQRQSTDPPSRISACIRSAPGSSPTFSRSRPRSPTVSANYIFGETAYQLSDTNIILVLFIHAYVQHSHMWIAFRGVLGRIFVSPAHHQVHHSANPKHFNKNFGSCLALWDWMFGTLYAPEKTREPLTFGFPGQPDARASWSIRSSMRRATSGRSGLRTCPPCRLLSASRPS